MKSKAVILNFVTVRYFMQKYSDIVMC